MSIEPISFPRPGLTSAVEGIKSVLCVCVCASVCPSVSALTADPFDEEIPKKSILNAFCVGDLIKAVPSALA